MTAFVLGSPARGPHFYGRADTLRCLNRQSWTWLCAQRRIGKTSVLYEFERLARMEGKTPLLFDLAFVPVRKASGSELFRRFFMQHHRNQGPLAAAGLELDSFTQMEPAESFRELIETLIRRGHQVVMLWDEAERLIDIEENDEGFLEHLRSVLHGISGLQFVICATQHLCALYGRPGRVSSFLATFTFLPMGGLDDASARELLLGRRTGGWQSPLPEELLQATMEFSGGHPLVLQEIGARLGEQLGYDGARAQSHHLRAGIDYLNGNPSLRAIFEDDFSRLSAPQQVVLTALCQAGQNLTLAQLVAQTQLEPTLIEDALCFLGNYGYVNSGPPVSLSFQFYRRVRPTTTRPPLTEGAKVDRLVRAVSTDGPTPSELQLTTARVRQQLNRQLRTDSELEAFCLDHFPTVHGRFSGAMDRTAKLNLLLQFAELSEIVSRMHAGNE